MDRLTMSTRFVLIKASYPLQKLAEIYIGEILKLHGIPLSIVSEEIWGSHQGFGRVFENPWEPS